jgi:ubiquinone/menaquinone biosynthesis C-methylase UbiE
MTEEITKFYNDDPDKEWLRLDDPYNIFELVSTLRVIDNFFLNKGSICDIGSGPGRYAIELLQRGHDVTLVDFSKELLEIAKRKVGEYNFSAQAQFICADARNLDSLPAESYDYIMVMGPMYHLHSSADRLKVLHEANRLLKNSGVAIIAYLNSWGVMRYGLERFSELYENKEFLECFLGVVSIEGPFQNFTEWFASTPPLAIDEMASAGFEVIHQIGCEAFASGMKPAIRRIAEENPKAYSNILELIPVAASLPQFRDTAEHVHFVVRKG